MSKTRSNFFKIVCLLCMCAMILSMAACSAGGTGTSATASTTGSVKPAQTTAVVASSSKPSDKPVTLKILYWSNPPFVDALKTLNAKFQEKYPNITAEATDIPPASWQQAQQTRIIAGDVDIMADFGYALALEDWATGANKQSWQEYIEQGLIEDITNQPFIKYFNDVAIKDATTFNGKVYGVPTGTVADNGVFYNKTIFDKYDLKVPQTWDEYMNLCKTLKSKGIAPMTVGGKDGWPYTMMTGGIIAAFTPDMKALAKQYFLGERKFNDEQSLKLWDKMAEWTSYMEDGFMGVDYASVIGRFVSGKAAMMPDGTWQAPTIAKTDPNFKFGYFVIPGDKPGDSTQLCGKYDLIWEVLSKSPNKDAALKWMEFYSQKENYTEFINTVGFIPTQDVQVKDEFVNSLFPMTKGFRLEYGQTAFLRKGAGKYACFTPQFLKVAGGPIKTAKELADLSQTDWDAAKPE